MKTICLLLAFSAVTLAQSPNPLTGAVMARYKRKH
jgi:hypothetical protein